MGKGPTPEEVQRALNEEKIRQKDLDPEARDRITADLERKIREDK